MKTIFHICLFTTAWLQLASADVPQKAPLVKYTGLWTNSPFTSRPVIGPINPVANVFDDFTLTGIAPVPGGYRITIMNKKKPDEKEVITPGETNNSGFKVVSVDRNPEKTLGTSVTLSSGSVQGTVIFEPDLMKLKAAPAGAPQQQQGNLPPGITPAMAGQQGAAQNPNGNAETRQPRPRIVPPPPPSATGNISKGATPVPGNPGQPQGAGQNNNSPSRTQHRR